MTHLFPISAFLLLWALLLGPSVVLAESEPVNRTESICNFGMAEDEAGRSCEVPIPANCTVANFPGSSEPWTNISKGGRTDCRFDEQHTDWETKITGSCGTCKTKQCSARFSVMFNCTTNIPPASQEPAPHAR